MIDFFNMDPVSPCKHLRHFRAISACILEFLRDVPESATGTALRSSLNASLYMMLDILYNNVQEFESNKH